MMDPRQVNTMTSTNGLAAMLCATVLLAACAGSPAVRHYLIAPLAGTGPTVALPAGKVFGLGPVTVPDYLARPQMALRTSASRIEYRDGHRWAEPFAENVRRVLKQNLAATLPGTMLRTYPWPRSEAVDYQLRLEITRFDADAGGNVTLEGTWSLLDGKGTELVPGRAIAITASATDASADAIAVAHGAALSQLAGEVAGTLATTTK